MRRDARTRGLGTASAGLALLASLTGCGSEINLGNAEKQVATVTGAIYYESGPTSPAGKPGPRGPKSGTITIFASNGTVAAHEKLRSTGYEFFLEPGAYTVLAQSGDAACEPTRIRAPLGKTTQADVICRTM